MKINIEEFAEKFMSKIKEMVSSESLKLRSELDDVKKSLSDFKVDMLQKTHDFQMKSLERELSKSFTSTKEKDEGALIVREELEPIEFDINFNEDDRLLTVKLGDQEKSIKLPTLIYRGIYTDEQVYEKGDFVTHQGSMWVCKSEEVKVKPGTEEGKEHWQLSVKKGRDGKDLKDNK